MTVISTDLFPPLRMSRRGYPATQSRQVEASCQLPALRCLTKENRKSHPQKKENKLTAYYSLQKLPLPPPSVRGAPCVLCSPTPRARCPLLLPLPPVLPTAVVARKPRIAWLHRSSANSSATLVRSLVWFGPGCFLVSSRTVAQRVFCWLFHCGQFLKRLASLDLELVPALVPGLPVVHWVLSCEAVFCLELVKPRGDLLVGSITVGSGFFFLIGWYWLFFVR